MEPLTPYRGGDWALCMYLRDEDQQQAFNLVAGCLPGVTIPHSFSPKGDFALLLLPPTNTNKSDPLGQFGYVGIQPKYKTLAPANID